MPRAATKVRLKERRKHQRLPLSVPVFVRGIDEQGKEFLEFATALNISRGGVLLAARRNLSQSVGVSLEIPVAPLPVPDITPPPVRSMKATFVRIAHGPRFHLVGLKFLRPLPR